jgi:hypothetical protein
MHAHHLQEEPDGAAAGSLRKHWASFCFSSSSFISDSCQPPVTFFQVLRWKSRTGKHCASSIAKQTDQKRTQLLPASQPATFMAASASCWFPGGRFCKPL